MACFNSRKSVVIALLLLVWLLPGLLQGAERPILQLSIQGAIGPATDDYVTRALDSAIRHRAELVILRMDTPGGLDSAMRNIIKNIINSPIPVATYVAPSGARAASAGTYILYASHIAAMAPGTNLGAATPVQIGGMPVPKDPRSKDKPGDSKPEAGNDDAMKQKMINDAVAYIRSLAQLHGRNEDWAEKAVRQAASLPANEALKLKVIDLVATDVNDLLTQIDGRMLKVQDRSYVIKTEGLKVMEHNPDWRNRLLSVITNPNVAYILLLIGIYGLIFEFSNPGAIVPGTVGAIALLLALYAFQMLPINYAGMGLILLGVALMVAEAFEPSFGMLGIGGTIAFVIGSIILMDTKAPGFGIDLALIVTFTVISILVFVFIVGMAMRARRKPVVSGAEELVGAEAVVQADFERQGTVSIHSEKWNAVCSEPLHKNQKVKVTGMKGLVLEVEPMESQQAEPEDTIQPEDKA